MGPTFSTAATRGEKPSPHHCDRAGRLLIFMTCVELAKSQNPTIYIISFLPQGPDVPFFLVKNLDCMIALLIGEFPWGYPKMVGLEGKKIHKWMIWGYNPL